MKTNILAVALLGLTMASCANRELPDNPTLSLPVTSLVLEVSGRDYVAVPTLNEDGSFTGELDLQVRIPNTEAVVKQVYLRDGYTVDFAPGDTLRFADSKLVVDVQGASGKQSYTVNMLFNPPPIVYAVKSSDRDAVGNRYFMNVETQDFLASATYDNNYEGELNLTGTNWDNVGLVSQDLTTIYEVAAGPWPAVSHYVWKASTKTAKGDGYFLCEGPWNDWKVTNGNPDIVSPGVWRVNFDLSKLEVVMTMTQWVISGSAVGTAKLPMTYDKTTKSWSMTADLKAGSFAFETIPVTFGDPTFRLGYKKNILGQLASDGAEISVPAAGIYELTLCLSNSPYYTYTLTRK